MTIKQLYNWYLKGEEQRLINYLQNATFSKGEFVAFVRWSGVTDKDALELAIFLLDN